MRASKGKRHLINPLTTNGGRWAECGLDLDDMGLGSGAGWLPIGTVLTPEWRLEFANDICRSCVKRRELRLSRSLDRSPEWYVLHDVVTAWRMARVEQRIARRSGR